ncbi:unnamed protein product [Sphagnum jensenii]|uniref:FAR1 domain-containing protein n=1 Tax=Sphagnum jensenii TaxID=128206 RepID=A0ABP1B678_9BRYO
MNPPLEATYNDVDALKAACRQHANVHLYSVTTKRSDYKMGVLLLHCGKYGTRDDRHGLTEETHQRPSNSVLTGYLFLLQIRRNRIGSWTLRVKCGEHNHSPLTREAAHPSHRKMTNDVKEHVRILFVAGVAPTQILTLIRSEPSGEHVITRDVYNLKR